MKITQKSPTVLTVKTNPYIKRLFFGIGLLIVGGFLTWFVRLNPISLNEFRAPQDLFPENETNQTEIRRTYETAEATFRVAHVVGKLTMTGERPLIIVAIGCLVIGLVIVLGPYRSQLVVFDKTKKRVILKQPRWFFRSKVEKHPWENISEISVERALTPNSNPEQCYGVTLIIRHSEGTPLSPNYIFYKTVFPLTATYQYNYQQAQQMANQINQFLT